MIQLITDIEKKLSEKWKTVLQSNATFINILNGKEGGHSIASYVDETTIKFIKEEFPSLSIVKEKKKRSIGDFWLNNGNCFIPFNIKTGNTNKGGSPNVVSLDKIYDFIYKHVINKYFLIIVLFQKNENWKLRILKIINILDYPEYLSYDYGPGQIMLKQDKFIKDIESGNIITKNILIKDTLKNLYKLANDNEKLTKFVKNRQAKLQKYKEQYEIFNDDQKLNQEKLKFDEIFNR